MAKRKSTTAKKTAPVKEEKTEVTPVAESPKDEKAAETQEFIAQEKPMSGEAELDFRKGEEIHQDHVATSVDEVKLEDKVITKQDELPDDHVAINKEASPYDEDIELLDEEPEPAKNDDSVWVSNPAEIKKIEGARDTLKGTLYLGKRR